MSAMAGELWLDVSNHDEPTYNPACFADVGVTGQIMGTWYPDIARRMIRKSRDQGGPDIEATYAFPTFGIAPEWMTEQSILVAQDFAIPMVWIDVEATGTYDAASGPSQRVRELWKCVELVQSAGLIPGIYSAGWYWGPYMGNVNEFAHLPLWHAQYLNSLGLVEYVNYGGWSRVHLHQYTSSVTLCGRVRDHNYVVQYPAMGDEMSAADLERIARLERIIGGNGILVHTNETNLAIAREVTNTPGLTENQDVAMTNHVAVAFLDKMGMSLFGGMANMQTAMSQLAEVVQAISPVGGGLTSEELSAIFARIAVIIREEVRTAGGPAPMLKLEPPKPPQET